MVNNQNTRRYEVSLWTLQDSFITVLKSFDVDHFGGIQEPHMELTDDSADTFTFQLPMYIHSNNEFIENPLWYNTTNGNLMENLRKVKVIFHKGEPREAVYEFVITKITETHEGFEKMCEIECEGLAYNELGKTGYNIELSQDIYEIDYVNGIKCEEECEIKSKVEDRNIIQYIQLSNRSEYVSEVKIIADIEEVGSFSAEDAEVDENTYVNTIQLHNVPQGLTKVRVKYKYIPLNNINYWMDKVFDSQFKWKYKINMNWDQYLDEDRDTDKIYEDAYIENWEMNEEDKLVPISIINCKEKFRIVSESGSNRYNLTQAIAETFGVFCRYVYEYDDNYYIIGRTVEFYNDALKENEEVLDFTYYYDTEKISREKDSADLISKMYVVTGSGDDMLTSSITEVEANKSLENYLLNFDYLHKTGAVDDEQIEYIEEFELKMREYNQQLRDLSTKITIYEEALNEFKVKRDSASVEAAQATEAMDNERAYINHLLNSDKTDYDGEPETLSMTGLNPLCVVINAKKNDDGTTTNECTISTNGVFPNSIVAFPDLSTAQTYYECIYGTDSQKTVEVITEEVDGVTKYKAQRITKTGTIVIKNGTSNYFDTTSAALDAASKWVYENNIGSNGISSDQYQIVIDPETGFATGLTNITYKPNSSTTSGSLNAIFLVFNYSLDLYHKILLQKWASIQAKAEVNAARYGKIVNKIDGERDDNGNWTSDDHGQLQEYKDEQEELLKEKQSYIIDFENYLGPALREGNWSPDGEYAKYGDRRQASLKLIGTSDFAEEGVSIAWDKNIFEGETLNYENYGIEKEKIYYPCIKLTENLLKAIQNYLEKKEEESDSSSTTIITEAEAENDNDEDENEQNSDSATKFTSTLTDIGFIWDDTAVPGINKLITDPSKKLEAEYPQIYHIGSEAQIVFLRSNTDENEPAFPVLMLTNADSYCSTYDIKNSANLSQTEILSGLNGCIGTLKVEETEQVINETTVNTYKYIVNSFSDESLTWISNNDLDKYDIVYPRIKIPFTNFVNNTVDCSLVCDEWELTAYSDYNIKSRYDINYDTSTTDLTFWESDNIDIQDVTYSYYITLNVETIIKNGWKYGDYTFFYKLSNTGLAIYLDSIKVLKENSMPKVSYEVAPTVFKPEFMEELYRRIHQIVHINDYELKFEDVAGYISGVTLELDKPWEDGVEVKNYTNKFEDLFSSIVASTETMRQNSTMISVASQAFVNSGEINESTLQKSFEVADLTLKFSNDNFILNDSGIKAYSDRGIVYYSNQGIFTATEKDEDGNWKWNTSILPSGISANAITTGQLDTNLIRIYSGDDLRFQMNGDGLFAYKSWFEEDLSKFNNAEAIGDIQQIINKRDGIDSLQYLMINEDGLFLKAKKDAYILNYQTYQISQMEDDVDRVEISWNGLVLRNNEGNRTFYADPDTGDLNITGNIAIQGLNTSAEFTNTRLKFGVYELVAVNTNESQCLAFVCYPDDV